MGEVVDPGVLRALAGEDVLNMTRLALNLSERVNGVASTHADVSRRLFPGYQVDAITNGVHPFTWTHPAFASLYSRYLPGWCHEPAILVRVDQIPNEAVWDAHTRAKADLIVLVKTLTGVTLVPDLPVLGFARRMTAYKRPDLLFSELDRLQDIAGRRPFQIVLAGKAHPRDEGGKQLIERLHAHIRRLTGRIPIAYLPNYGMDIAAAMTAGSDVWLNTPLRPLEASGTSGMKAAFNGVPSLSVLDGWWVEGCIEGVTGWAIGDASESSNGADAKALYAKLDNVVLPLLAGPRAAWIDLMKGAIGKNAAYFNSHRMMRRYAVEAYLR